MVILFLVLFGLILGSFVNALIYRFHAQDEINDRLSGEDGDPKPSAKEAKELRAKLKELSMVHGRSMCSKCHHPLAAKDLIPFFSWLFLGGKCRYCKHRIEDPPIIELVMPAVFVLSYIFWPMELAGYGLVALIFWLAISVGLVALAAYDFRWFLLPDRIVWPLVVIALVQVLLHAFVFDGGVGVLVTAFWGVVIDSGLFFVLYQVSKGTWIGGGDVKLGILLGLLAGGVFPAIMIIFGASLLGTFASVPLLVHKKLRRKSVIPFGPFLIMAGAIVVLFGQSLTNLLDRILLIGL